MKRGHELTRCYRRSLASRATERHPSAPMTTLLTMQQAARPLFGWSYNTLRSRIKRLEAEGCPIDWSTGRPVFYPPHVEAWRIARYDPVSQRALRAAKRSLDEQTS